MAVAIVRLLTMELGVPAAIAVSLVRAAAHDATIGALRTPSGVRLELPERFAADIRTRLEDALQAAPRRPRGRPPRAST